MLSVIDGEVQPVYADQGCQQEARLRFQSPENVELDTSMSEESYKASYKAEPNEDLDDGCSVQVRQNDLIQMCRHVLWRVMDAWNDRHSRRSGHSVLLEYNSFCSPMQDTHISFRTMCKPHPVMMAI
jgi:hypothetical protein